MSAALFSEHFESVMFYRKGHSTFEQIGRWNDNWMVRCKGRRGRQVENDGQADGRTGNQIDS